MCRSVSLEKSHTPYNTPPYIITPETAASQNPFEIPWERRPPARPARFMGKKDAAISPGLRIPSMHPYLPYIHYMATHGPPWLAPDRSGAPLKDLRLGCCLRLRIASCNRQRTPDARIININLDQAVHQVSCHGSALPVPCHPEVMAQIATKTRPSRSLAILEFVHESAQSMLSAIRSGGGAQDGRHIVHDRTGICSHFPP